MTTEGLCCCRISGFDLDAADEESMTWQWAPLSLFSLNPVRGGGVRAGVGLLPSPFVSFTGCFPVVFIPPRSKDSHKNLAFYFCCFVLVFFFLPGCELFKKKS